MSNADNIHINDLAGAQLIAGASLGETFVAEGIFHLEHVRPVEFGGVTLDCVLWRESFRNTVVTVGKNQMLDAALAGAAYTVTGPYMGLISSVGYSAISAADTMASHAGWTEAGNANAPTYTAPRKTAAWSAASGGAKSLSAALAFSITGTGTIKGAFMVYGAGASATIDNTGGTLFSAGLFTGGDRAVLSGDVVNVSYTITLS